MPDQPATLGQPARSGRDGRRPPAGHVLALMTATLAFAVAACGGNSTAANAPAVSSAPGGGQNAPRTPGVSGTAAAVSASSLEVQNPNSGQVTVNFNSSTTFINAVAGSLQDVTVGACVMVAGNPGGAAGAPVTARSVTITQPSGNGCAPGPGGGGGRPGGGGGGGNGGGGGGGGGGSQPSGTNRPVPNGGRAFGSVASVTGNTFTVTGNNRSSGATTTTTVTVDSSTTYTKEVTADSGALAVGECIAATGASDNTGAVTARTIAISKPGANGNCFAGGRNPGGNGG